MVSNRFHSLPFTNPTFKSIIPPFLHFQTSLKPIPKPVPVFPNPGILIPTRFSLTTRTLKSSSSLLTPRAGWLLGLGERKKQTLPDLVKAGDPVLHEPAREVDPDEIGSERIQKIIDDMVGVMRMAPGVGLAAPQIGVPLRIMKLMYTTSGSALLALSSNGVHKLWKWQVDHFVIGEEASTNVKPKLWTPSSGYIMTNETVQANPEGGAVPCLAISENDNYVVSASGGKICLYNMLNFKKMYTFISPPPAATSVAFHPKDNNVIAIGMDDSTIHIYNAQSDELVSKLQGHRKMVRRSRVNDV